MAAASDLKVIAFYLPQFHPIPENDLWWGKGFTEWTNVAKAQPLFEGHYQPHLPADLGFYDLRVPELRHQQVSLAREYGVHGFCYYYYWFSGRRILERPLNDFVADKALQFPFCICWANENWTRRWDGQEHELLLEQKYSEADDLVFIRELLPLLQDPRYIRVSGSPLILIYRVDKLPNAQRTTQVWRREAARHGISTLHICAVEFFPIQSPADYGCDSVVEFPPHTFQTENYASDIQQECPNFIGVVRDYREVVQASIRRSAPAYRYFRGVCPSWDNSARTGQRATIYRHSSPAEYELWLHAAAEYTCQQQPPEDRFLFINAWNEWAEGTHLEPDQRYGKQFLEATRRVVAGERHWRNILSTLKNTPNLPHPRMLELLDQLGLFLEGRERAIAYLMNKQIVVDANSPTTRVVFLDQAMVPEFKLPTHIAGQVFLDSITPNGSAEVARLCRGSLVKFQGWAFVQGRAIKRDHGLIFVLVHRNTGACFFAHASHRQERPDVSAAFPHIDAACTYWSGFDIDADIDAVPPGLYHVGIIQLEKSIFQSTALLPSHDGAKIAYVPFMVEVVAGVESMRSL